MRRSPTTHVTSTGKNTISAHTSTFGSRPVPNQRIRIGAMATTGNAWLAAINGASARSSSGRCTTRYPSTTATAIPSAAPNPASRSVTRTCGQSMPERERIRERARVPLPVAAAETRAPSHSTTTSFQRATTPITEAARRQSTAPHVPRAARSPLMPRGGIPGGYGSSGASDLCFIVPTMRYDLPFSVSTRRDTKNPGDRVVGGKSHERCTDAWMPSEARRGARAPRTAPTRATHGDRVTR